MWLNNPRCGHKEGQTFPIFCCDNHQGKSSHMYKYMCYVCPLYKKKIVGLQKAALSTSHRLMRSFFVVVNEVVGEKNTLQPKLMVKEIY